MDEDASTDLAARRADGPTNAQRAALDKFAVDPKKRVKTRKPPSRNAFLRLAIILSVIVVALVVTGGLMFKLNPSRSPLWYTGEILLLAAAMFVVSLLYVAGRGRRR